MGGERQTLSLQVTELTKKSEENSLEPEVVADVVLTALTTGSPRSK